MATDISGSLLIYAGVVRNGNTNTGCFDGLEWTGLGSDNIYLGQISLEQNISVCMKNNRRVLIIHKEQANL